MYHEIVAHCKTGKTSIVKKTQKQRVASKANKMLWSPVKTNGALASCGRPYDDRLALHACWLAGSPLTVICVYLNDPQIDWDLVCASSNIWISYVLHRHFTGMYCHGISYLQGPFSTDQQSNPDRRNARKNLDRHSAGWPNKSTSEVSYQVQM